MTKTSKRLIITFSIIGALVVLMIVFGAFFSLRSIYVDPATSINRIEEYDEAKIIETSGIKKGKNIIFMNFDKATANLEKNFPYAKFEIVRTFPNKVTIYMTEREPVFRIKASDGLWHIYDEELKCLEIVPESLLSSNGNDKVPVLNILSGEKFKFASDMGERVDDVVFQSRITSIVDGIVYGAGLSMTDMSDITLEYDENNSFEISTFTVRETADSDKGTKVVVQGTSYFKEKLATGLKLYMRDIRQYDPKNNGKNHTGHLDKVTITVYNSFKPSPSDSTKFVIVSCTEDA